MDLIYIILLSNCFLLAASSTIFPKENDISDALHKISKTIRFDSISERIVGGQEALDEQFPYQAGLMLTTEGRTGWCGGSLIDRRWILTAAHCLEHTQNATVYLGTHKILGINEIGIQIIKVTSDDFIIHEDYYPTLVINDIGLIHLPVDARISRDIKLIALPDATDIVDSYEGVNAVCSGWGRFADSIMTVSSVLRYADLEVISNSDCSLFFGSILIGLSKICTDGFTLKGPCNGDSGGPLAYRNGKKNILIGIVSFGSSSGCESKYPAVFSRVTYYLNWIKRNTGI